MRRGILVGIGLLETLVACVLFAVGWRLPRQEAVDESFQRLGSVTHGAQKQVQLMRHQVVEVRQKDFPKAASQLRAQTRVISANLRAQTIDFETVEAMSAALAAVAQGLEGWSETFDVATHLAAARTEALGEPVDFSIPLLAASIDAAASALENDARRAFELLCRPPDAGNRIEFVLTFLRCAHRLDALRDALNREKISAARDGFRDLELSMATAVQQVDAISSVVYPVVTPGPVPTVEFRPLWPEGKRTAEGLRKALTGVKSVNREIDDLAQNLDGSGNAFTDAVASGLPHASISFVALMRGTERLRELAGGLRKTHQGLAQTLRSWPELVETIRHSATVLNGSRRQLDTVLSQRVQYERAVNSSLHLTQTTEDLLQAYTSKLDVRLGEQEHSLGQMERGLGEVNDALPLVGKTTSDLLNAVRWMFWLIGGLIALHGVFIAVEAQLKR